MDEHVLALMTLSTAKENPVDAQTGTMLRQGASPIHSQVLSSPSPAAPKSKKIPAATSEFWKCSSG